MESSISAPDLARRLLEPAPPLLLDVRQPEEHEFVALPDSRLLPLNELPDRAAAELAAWKDAEIVVYCHHGMRSQRAIAILRTLGFTRLCNLTGGIDAWSVEVDPSRRRY